MSETSRITVVNLPSVGYAPTRIEDMTLDQAREAIQVIGNELFQLRESQLRTAQIQRAFGSTRTGRVLDTYIEDVKKATDDYIARVKAELWRA